ncbi:MAG: hypothetical protein M3P83_04935, partial [Actinomycetota bacterium]|nr:hypothetical protein [Actinomycetota bacterium]
MTRQARLLQVDPRGTALVFDLEPSQVTEGGLVGGWEEVPHPKRPASTEYRGQPLRTLSIDVLFDGWRAQRPVEAQLRVLRIWGSIPRGRREPPVLRFEYANYGMFRWVVNGLEWGDSLRRFDQQRVRQAVTVQLLEYRDVEVRPSPARRAVP